MAVPAEHQQTGLVSTRHTVCVAIVGECRAPIGNRVREYRHDGFGDADNRSAVDQPAWGCRVDSGGKEHLIDVNVAEASEYTLVEEDRLHGCATTGKSSCQVAGAESVAPIVFEHLRFWPQAS